MRAGGRRPSGSPPPRVLPPLGVAALAHAPAPSTAPGRWSEQQANDWYKAQPWLVGANYVPASAINELEMWQADTFDPKRIDTELGWAAGIGMNTMRVFLHDLLWQQDADGFKKRLLEFLGIADKHRIKTMFVLFNSVWDPHPQLGRQRAPKPGVHNSGWLQSRGAKACTTSRRRARSSQSASPARQRIPRARPSAVPSQASHARRCARARRRRSSPGRFRESLV